MAITSVQEFLDKVEQDEALRAELATVLQTGNERRAVTELAQSKGYKFSPEELLAEVEKRKAEGEKNLELGELSNEDLEQVAGGLAITQSNGPLSPAVNVACVMNAGGCGMGKLEKW